MNAPITGLWQVSHLGDITYYKSFKLASEDRQGFVATDRLGDDWEVQEVDAAFSEAAALKLATSKLEKKIKEADLEISSLQEQFDSIKLDTTNDGDESDRKFYLKVDIERLLVEANARKRQLIDWCNRVHCPQHQYK